MATTTPTAPTAPAAPRISDPATVEDRSADLRRITRLNRRLALFLVAALVAVAAVALLVDGSPSPSRADAASTARWGEAAAQYEAMRAVRANHAWTARLDAAATHHEAIRRVAALDADAARLTRQAEVRAAR